MQSQYYKDIFGVEDPLQPPQKQNITKYYFERNLQALKTPTMAVPNNHTAPGTGTAVATKPN